jgi:hypothetical protein
MELLVVLSVRVLHRHERSELDVVADGVAEGSIIGHTRVVQRGQVELNETLPLLLGDGQPPVYLDQMGEAEFAAKAIRAAERLSSERGQVVDVLGPPRSEQRLEDGIGKNARVEDVFEAMKRLHASGMLKERGHKRKGSDRWALPGRRAPGPSHIAPGPRPHDRARTAHRRSLTLPAWPTGETTLPS